jgi:hypothetical protein
VMMGKRERNNGITRKIIRGAAESSQTGDLAATFATPDLAHA